jgi:hypothetical protein
MLPETQIWLVAVPGDDARERWLTSGADQHAVFDANDVLEFVAEWNKRRNIYHKAARFDLDAPGPRIASTRVFRFAWLDLDLVPKPEVASAKLIDMAVNALDGLVHGPSTIVSTGGGVQALFHFDQPLVVGTKIPVGPEALQVPAHVLIESINRGLARVFAGDVAVCHPAGGLRLPFTTNVNRAGSVARTLRVQPGRVCKAVDLYLELGEIGARLGRAKDGSWAVLSRTLSKVQRIHALAGQGAGGGGSGVPAKTQDEWAEIKRALVIKGGRNVATARYAGWLARRGLSEDDAVDSLIERSEEAAAEVRAGGGEPRPLSRGEITTVVRSVFKTHVAHTAHTSHVGRTGT